MVSFDGIPWANNLANIRVHWRRYMVLIVHPHEFGNAERGLPAQGKRLDQMRAEFGRKKPFIMVPVHGPGARLRRRES